MKNQLTATNNYTSENQDEIDIASTKNILDDYVDYLCLALFADLRDEDLLQSYIDEIKTNNYLNDFTGKTKNNKLSELSVDDIHTLEEMYCDEILMDEFKQSYPEDFSDERINEIFSTGEIVCYSLSEFKPGAFVTPVKQSLLCSIDKIVDKIINVDEKPNQEKNNVTVVGDNVEVDNDILNSAIKEEFLNRLAVEHKIDYHTVCWITPLIGILLSDKK